MKFVDEYRDPVAARALVAEITQLAGDAHFKFMEVCGGHTHTIYRHGIEHVLPQNVELVHGPGCPVCVIPMGRVDDAIAVAEEPGVIFTSFGDMMRVPGSNGNLLGAKARGADVRFVYSPLDALKIAIDTPDREVVFFAVGFETTAPSTAVTLLRARDLGVTNFRVFCNHVTIVPPIKAILESPDLRLDGFLGPGHVSTVVGNRPYRFVPDQYGKPLVTAGFEPLDILQAIMMLLKQLCEGRCEVENQYARVVRDEGNPRALRMLAEVFELRPHFEWRGLGFISQSALRLRPEFSAFDAELRYELPNVRVADPKACQCGEVLKGVIKPWECKVFGTACTPETPIGTCMVSSEGACAAYYNFGRLHREGCRHARTFSLIPGDARFRAVLEASDDAVFSVDADHRITDWNRNAERIFGYVSSDMLGQSLAKVLAGDGAPQAHAALETAWTGHGVHHLEVDLQRRDGMTVPISLTVVPVVGLDGPPSALVVVARDITERQVAQAALAEAEVRVHESELLAHDGAWLWDVRTGAVQWTDELYRVAGLDPSDFAGTVEGHLAVMHVDDRDDVRDAMEAAVAKGEVFEILCRIVRPDGSELQVEVRGAPAAAYAGTIVGLRGTVREVTT